MNVGEKLVMRWPGLVRQPEQKNKQFTDIVVVVGFRQPLSVY